MEEILIFVLVLFLIFLYFAHPEEGGGDIDDFNGNTIGDVFKYMRNTGIQKSREEARQVAEEHYEHDRGIARALMVFLGAVSVLGTAALLRNR